MQQVDVSLKLQQSELKIINKNIQINDLNFEIDANRISENEINPIKKIQYTQTLSLNNGAENQTGENPISKIFSKKSNDDKEFQQNEDINLRGSYKPWHILDHRTSVDQYHNLDNSHNHQRISANISKNQDSICNKISKISNLEGYHENNIPRVCAQRRDQQEVSDIMLPLQQQQLYLSHSREECSRDKTQEIPSNILKSENEDSSLYKIHESQDQIKKSIRQIDQEQENKNDRTQLAQQSQIIGRYSLEYQKIPIQIKHKEIPKKEQEDPRINSCASCNII